MQPKPIDSRHLIDIDAQKRLANTEGIQHLHGVRDQKEHPAETGYDAVHDEANRRGTEETAKQLIERLKKARAGSAKGESETAEDSRPESRPLPNGQKGSNLDVEA